MKSKQRKRRGRKTRMLALFLVAAMIMTLNTSALTWASSPADAVTEEENSNGSNETKTAPAPEGEDMSEAPEETLPEEETTEETEVDKETEAPLEEDDSESEEPGQEEAPEPEETPAAEETPVPQPTEEPVQEVVDEQTEAMSTEVENPVAQIGETGYETLQAAFDAADGDTTVTLLADIVMSTDDIATISAGKQITLDMDGKSITVDETFLGRPIVNEGSLTVTGGGTIDSTASESDGHGAINNKGSLTIVNGTYRGATKANGSAIRNTGADAQLVIEAGTFETATSAVYNEGTATINGGTFAGTTCSRCDSQVWSYTIRNAAASSKMTINGGTFTGIQGAASAAIGSLTINDGIFKTLKCSTHGQDATYYALYAAGEVGEVECVINGGHFETEGKITAVLIGNDTPGDGGINAPATAYIKGGTFVAPAGVPAIKSAAETGDPQISGGNFSSEVDPKYMAEGFELVANEDGKFIVQEKPPVASIGETTYSSLAKAVEAAVDGQTITVLADMDISEGDVITVPSGKTITLDLAGCEIESANTEKGRIIVDGGLTLKDSTVDATTGVGTGKIYSETRGGAYCIIQVHGTFTMESGVIETAMENPVSNGNFGVAVERSGQITINGGMIKAGWYAIAGNGNNEQEPVITINGGTLISTIDYVIYQPVEKGTLNITGGLLQGAAGGIAVNDGKVNMSGGTIDAFGGGNVGEEGQQGGDGTIGMGLCAINLEGRYGTVEAEISGGEVKAAEGVKLIKTNDAVLKISGGIYSGPIDEKYCAEGYEPTENADGTYGVKVSDPVASIGDTPYPSLAAAVESAKTGDTITVVKDIAVEWKEQLVFPSGKELTLDLSGKNITGDFKGIMMAVEGSLTIKDSAAKSGPVISDDYKTVTYAAGTIKNSNNGGSVIDARKGGKLVIESGQIHAPDRAVISRGNQELGNTSPVKSEVTIKGGYLLGMAQNSGFGAVIFGNGAILNITGGVIVSEDNAAVSGNGSKDSYGTDINISGGTIISRTAEGSNGYISCGVYHPQAGTLDISAGTIYSDSGAGVLMRGGQLNMTGGEVISTGTASGKVCDSGASVSSSGILIHCDEDYKDYENIKVQITGGTVRAENTALNAVADAGLTVPDGAMAVSGGKYSNAIVPEYCADGYQSSKEAGADKLYTVSKANNITVTADPAKGGTAAVKDAVTKAVAGDKITLEAKADTAGDYKFKEWKVTAGGVTIDKNNTFIMGDKEVNITAVFELNTHKITVTDDGNGTGSATPATAKKGDKVTLKATPKHSDYKLKSWQVVSGGVSVGKDGTFVMGDKDVTVKAIFEKKEGLKQEVSADGDKFFVYEDGSHKTGWHDATDTWTFYLDPEDDGAAATGFKKIGDEAYLFDANGLLVKKDATPVVNGKKYWTTSKGTLGSGKMVLGNMMLYFDEDTYEAQTGISEIEGKHYLFNKDGVLIIQAGTPMDSQKKYWFKPDGSLGSGWMHLGNMKLYFDPKTFDAAIGPKEIGDKTCLFNKDGVLLENSGTPEVNGKKYWIKDNGELGKDWMTLTTWKMYFDPKTHAAATGLQEIDGKKYLFNKDGVCYMLSRTDVVDGKKYWFNSDGSLGTGWKNLAGMMLYFNPDTCEAAIGTVTIDGKQYTFNKDGVMQK